MNAWWRFVLVGLILAFVAEAQLKLVAGINPSAFAIVLVAYPIIMTLAYGAHRLTDRLIHSPSKADLVFYFASGIAGLGLEWGLLGNGPASNAFQPGMFAMWTTFLFGPRILTRTAPAMEKPRRRFWWTFALTSVALAVVIRRIGDPNATVVFVVYALSGTYIVWSAWLLGLAWRTRRETVL